MLQHTSSEVIIFRLQINLNSKNTTHCTDWELTKLIDIKRQEYANLVVLCQSILLVNSQSVQ